MALNGHFYIISDNPLKAFRGNLPGIIGFLPQRFYNSSQSGVVSFGEKNSGSSNLLPHSHNVRSHERLPAGHSLNHGKAHTLIMSGKDDHVSDGEKRGHIRPLA